MTTLREKCLYVALGLFLSCILMSCVAALLYHTNHTNNVYRRHRADSQAAAAAAQESHHDKVEIDKIDHGTWQTAATPPEKVSQIGRDTFELVYPDRIELFVGIPSKGSSSERRAQVRDVWARELERVSNGSMIVRFIVSRFEWRSATLHEEASRFGDIWPMPESLSLLDKDIGYNELAIKTFAIVYLGEAIGAQFVCKCDDDVYVVVDRLVEETRNLWPRERLYLGRMWTGMSIIVNEKSPWDGTGYVQETGLQHHYPKYMSGGMYVLSRDLVALLVRMDAIVALQRWRSEDVSIGTWLTPFDIVRVDHRGFLVGGPPHKLVCQFRERFPLQPILSIHTKANLAVVKHAVDTETTASCKKKRHHFRKKS
jgi:Galactosyltransferase